MTDCEKIREEFSGYVDGIIHDLSRKRLEKHLETCILCRSEFVKLQDTIRMVRSLPEMSPPPELRHAVLSRLKTMEPHTLGMQRKTIYLAVFSAAAVFLLLMAAPRNDLTIQKMPATITSSAPLNKEEVNSPSKETKPQLFTLKPETKSKVKHKKKHKKIVLAEKSVKMEMKRDRVPFSEQAPEPPGKKPVSEQFKKDEVEKVSFTVPEAARAKVIDAAKFLKVDFKETDSKTLLLTVPKQKLEPLLQSLNDINKQADTDTKDDVGAEKPVDAVEEKTVVKDNNDGSKPASTGGAVEEKPAPKVEGEENGEGKKKDEPQKKEKPQKQSDPETHSDTDVILEIQFKKEEK